MIASRCEPFGGLPHVPWPPGRPHRSGGAGGVTGATPARLHPPPRRCLRSWVHLFWDEQEGERAAGVVGQVPRWLCARCL